MHTFYDHMTYFKLCDYRSGLACVCIHWHWELYQEPDLHKSGWEKDRQVRSRILAGLGAERLAGS